MFIFQIVSKLFFVSFLMASATVFLQTPLWSQNQAPSRELQEYSIEELEQALAQKRPPKGGAIGNGGGIVKTPEGNLVPADFYFKVSDVKYPVYDQEFSFDDFPGLKEEYTLILDFLRVRSAGRIKPEMLNFLNDFRWVYVKEFFCHDQMSTTLPNEQVACSYTRNEFIRNDRGEVIRVQKVNVMELHKERFVALGQQHRGVFYQALKLVHERIHQDFKVADHDIISPIIEALNVIIPMLKQQRLYQGFASQRPQALTPQLLSVVENFQKHFNAIVFSNHGSPDYQAQMEFAIEVQGGGLVSRTSDQSTQDVKNYVSLDSIVKAINWTKIEDNIFVSTRMAMVAGYTEHEIGQSDPFTFALQEKFIALRPCFRNAFVGVVGNLDKVIECHGHQNQFVRLKIQELNFNGNNNQVENIYLETLDIDISGLKAKNINAVTSGSAIDKMMPTIQNSVLSINNNKATQSFEIENINLQGHLHLIPFDRDDGESQRLENLNLVVNPQLHRSRERNTNNDIKIYILRMTSDAVKPFRFDRNMIYELSSTKTHPYVNYKFHKTGAVWGISDTNDKVEDILWYDSYWTLIPVQKN
jgi:hypothetical protein